MHCRGVSVVGRRDLRSVGVFFGFLGALQGVVTVLRDAVCLTEGHGQIRTFTADERAATVTQQYEMPQVEAAPAVDLAVDEQSAPAGEMPAASGAHSSAELLEEITGTASDAPLCMTCGIKMRPAGSCYVCEGCGSTSGCS